jgi:uracil-DNA glycosylase
MNINALLGDEWDAFLPKAADILKPIYDELKDEISAGIVLCPPREKVFRVFRELTPEQVRIVLIGQDPYHNPIGQATGRAFECGKFASPSWRKIYRLYEDEVGINPDISKGRLDKWANQGVFLLNKALTVRHQQANAHTRLWEPFTKYVVSRLLTDFQPRAFILLGAEVSRMIPKVQSPHKGFYYEHPMAAGYQNRSWEAKGLFRDVNEFIKFHYGNPIEW